MSKTCLIAFSSEEKADEFTAVLDFHYGHTRIQTCGMLTDLEDSNKFQHTYYWVLVKLGFNMSYMSMKSKFGKTITESKYFLTRSISHDLENEKEEFLPQLKSNLQLLFKNDAGFTTFNTLLEQETKRHEFKQEQHVSKKRKHTYD